SAEALIDNLVKVGSQYHPFFGGELDPNSMRLLEAGFDAVPALIEHLEDIRLTRGMQLGFNNFRSYHLRVGHLVSDLLQGLAGEELGRDWLERQRGCVLDKADVLDWWKKAQKMGEEKYMVANVLRRPGSELNLAMLTVIEKKYPQHLSKLYRSALEELPLMETWPLAEAVRRSSLPRKNKVELFLLGVKNECLEYRSVALRQLREVAPDQYRKLLVENLTPLPKTPAESSWESFTIDLAGLVLAEEDPSLWAMLTKVAKRSDVSLRLKILKNTQIGIPNLLLRPLWL